jgi:hypothetical protein
MATLSANLQAIMDLNAKAVAMYQVGRNHDARASLSQALCELKNLTETEDSNTDVSDNDCNAALGGLYNQSSHSSNGASSMAYSVMPYCEDTDVSAHEIYRGAFFVTYKSQAPLSSVAAVLLFNNGLLYHRAAMKNGKSAAMIKALQLYGRSFALLESIRSVSVPVIAMKAALCHNMVHIYKTFHQPAHARSLMNIEAVLVNWMQSQNDIQQTDLDFFRMSVYFAGMDDLRFAPAA